MSNVVNLSKGAKVSLEKIAPSLTDVRVGLGWQANPFNGHDFDLDVSVLLLGVDGKVAQGNAGNFVFYNNLISPCGSVEHQGDELTGGENAAGQDDEEVIVHLPQIPSHVDRIAFVVSIFEADARKQNFGQVRNSYIRLVNQVTGQEIVHYDLEEDFSTEQVVTVGELYRKGSGWSFSAIGAGFNDGLAGLIRTYGLQA